MDLMFHLFEISLKLNNIVSTSANVAVDIVQSPVGYNHSVGNLATNNSANP